MELKLLLVRTLRSIHLSVFAARFAAHPFCAAQSCAFFLLPFVVMNDEELIRHPLDLSAVCSLTQRHAWLGVVASQPGYLMVDSWQYRSAPALDQRLAAHVQLDEALCSRVLESCKESIEMAVKYLMDMKNTAQRAAADATKLSAAASNVAVKPATLSAATSAAATAAAQASLQARAVSTLPALPVPLSSTHRSAFDGRWDVNVLGRFEFVTIESHVHAYRVRGSYAMGNGAIRGLLLRSTSATAGAPTALPPHPSAAKDWRDAGGWTLIGVWKAHDHNGWKPCRFDFDAQFQVLRGSWSNGSEHGPFTGQRVDFSPTTLSLKKGLWNMGTAFGIHSPARLLAGLRHVGEVAHNCECASLLCAGLGNTCYMNSFLQAMYMTVGLRQELLRVPCAIDYARAEALYNAKLKAEGKEPPKPIAPQFLPPGPSGACAPSPLVTIQRLQRLYLNLLLSQRTAVLPGDFQSGLPDPWRGPNQQDSGEFGLWMLDQLGTAYPSLLKVPSLYRLSSNLCLRCATLYCAAESGLKAVHSELDYDAMFSGVMANCVQCSDCHKISRKDEKFKLLQLPIPNQYRPITGAYA